MREITGFATDHRSVVRGEAFLAIKGANFDGHDFAEQAYRNGASVVVAERPVSPPHILVGDLVQALARFASELRSDFHGPVIGITGSAGKTSTKEFVAAALKPLGPVLKTAGNRNTEYTSPLLWAELEPGTRAVVVEMAMRGFGQIAHLASFARPTHAVVTNIGYSHLEMVGSRVGIARAKGELLQALPMEGSCILWAEDDFFGTLRELAGDRPVHTFGFSPSADCRILEVKSSGWTHSVVHGELHGAAWEAELPAIGRHMALNAASAILVASLVGVLPEKAAQELNNAELPSMRMEVRELNGATVLLDNYNASPPAMVAALEALRDAQVIGRRWAVLGEMRELGSESEELHRQIGAALAGCDLEGVALYGDTMASAGADAALAAGFPSKLLLRASSLEDVRHFLSNIQPGDALLIKGSRALELERVLP